MSSRARRRGARLAWLAGLALVGYGGLVLVGLIAHESLVAATGSLLLGALLLLRGEPPAARSGRPALVAGVGLAAAGGVTFYNLAFASTFILPEWGLLVYGLALVVAAGNLENRIGPVDVSTLVGWSFPLLAGPLALFAIDAALTDPGGRGVRSLAAPVIARVFVVPMALVFDLVGQPVATRGPNLIVETADGSLTLGVGLVCAGVYPLVLFLGLLGLHAWQSRSRPRTAGVQFALGAAGLYLFNLTRLVALVEVGRRWGPTTLQTVHAHLGWVLYAVFAVLFWVVVVPHVEADPSQA